MTKLSTPNKGYKIFVSYAHDDDKLDSWVSKLRSKLSEATEIDLKNKLKGGESSIELKITMDHEFTKVGSISARIKEQLAQADMLLVVMSPSYLNSDWCKNEGEWFTKEQRARQDLRIFIVEKEHTKRDEWPGFLKDKDGNSLFSHQFYKSSNANEFEPREVTDESGDLHPGIRSVFRKLRRDVSEAVYSLGRPVPLSPTTDSVFLALTADDLTDYERAELEALLVEHRIRVLPASKPDDHESLQALLSEELGECKLFVQLLSRARASFPVSDPTGGIRFQFEAATAKKVPVLQWFHGDIQIERIANPEYGAFLEERKRHACQAEDMQALAQEIVRELEHIEPVPRPRERRMGINWDKTDEALAKELRLKIEETWPDQAVLPVLPSTEVAWEQRKVIYQECDGMILVWDKAGPQWVFRQILNVLPELWPAEPDKAKALADYSKPRAEDKLGFDPKAVKSVEVLDFTEGLDAESLRKFCERA